MDFADEHYVKLFTRDTVTWLSWPWEARALFPLLMRKFEHAGILRVGAHDPARAVALIVNIPPEVVGPGLDALLADGTVELTSGALIAPKFNEAQESRKTNSQAKREQREKTKSLARAAHIAMAAQLSETSQQHRQTTADDGRRRQTTAESGRSGHPPSPAQPVPCPAQPEKNAGAKPKREPKPPDPRHQPLAAELVKAFERETGAKYPFGPIDAAAVTALLAKGAEPTIVAAWAKALRSSAYPVVRTLSELVKHLAHFVGATGPPANRRDEPTTPRPEGRVLL